MGKFIITKVNNTYKATLHANNGIEMLYAKNADSIKEVKACIEKIKRKTLDIENHLKRLFVDDGHSYCIFDSTNNLIASGKAYQSEESRDRGIETMLRNLEQVVVEDRTSGLLAHDNSFL